MAKDASSQSPAAQPQPLADEFLVQHLVDPTDWVSDSARTLCNVCTRQFGTFRRKHHCRMCGDVVCSNCTLLKSALLPTIGYTRVRVCVTCVFNHVPAPSKTQQAAVAPLPANASISSPTEEAREWLSSHVHSPLSKSDDDESDTEDSYDNNHRAPGKKSSNQAFKASKNRSRVKQQAEAASETRSASPPVDASSPSSKWSHPWPKPPVAADEASRLEALYALEMLDSSPEKPFDMICDLAKARLSCPMAAVSFMDEHRQWFKASVGLAHKMIPRKIAFCAYTVFTKEPVVVLDTLKDKRFECNPLVSGAAAVRFYAAAPIVDPSSGHAVGSVFVLDTRPRESCDVAILERLAHAASENLPRVSAEEEVHYRSYNQASRLSPAPSSASTASLSSSSSSLSSSLSSPPSSAAGSPMSNNNNSIGKQTSSSSSSLSAVLTTTAAPTALSTTSSSSSKSTGAAPGEQMEMLLMRLLTQNTETQQQLATQQMSISNTLGFHSTQISKLMTDFARMEAKIEATIK